MRPIPFTLVLVLALSASAHAQRTGRLEGDATDSLHARPLVGATVLVSSTTPGSSELFTALTDDRGRFHVDSLSPGAYSVVMIHPVLDSLDLVLPPREVTIPTGAVARLTLALPSSATLRARACPGLTLPKGTGAVVGQVEDAEHDQALPGATVVLDWTDVAFDISTMKSTLAPRSASVRTDSIGGFRFCGVPTEIFLLLQVQQAQRVGTAIRVSVPEAAGVAVLHLSYSESSSRAISAVADTSPSGESLVPPLSGTAKLTGTVRTPDGQPLADASVRVADAAATARTDAQGSFALDGLPAGTQLLEVKRVGYLVTQQRVDLRPARSTAAEVTLNRIVTLDSVRILAQRSRYKEATERQRRKAGSATYMSEDQIERARPSQTSDLFTRLGIQVKGSGLDTKVVVRRGPMSLQNSQCPMNIVIDGMQHQDVNLVEPEEIGMMEIYKGPAGAPTEYDSACGVVVIWTKR